MIGQWCGDYTGTNQGYTIINIEEVKNTTHAALYFFDDSVDTPGLVCWIILNKELKSQVVEHSLLFPINPQTFLVEENKRTFLFEYDKYHPDYKFPNKIKIKLDFIDDNLNLEVESDLDHKIVAKLENKISSSGSKVNASTMSWREFKDYVSDVDYRNVVFRGQEDIWPLRTSFNRNQRYDVLNYVLKDIPMLYGKLSGTTQHLFNLNNDIENGAFYSLLQHHGYPTPLLDWTYSPYVAAFFAFRNLTSSVVGSGEIGRRVRIFIFDFKSWCNSYAQYKNIGDCRFHVSVGEFLPINNLRALPQQALTTYTNVYDIEGYIIDLGKGAGIDFLKAIDIPVSEYYAAIKDLSLMGVTSSTLFPGIDGVCEEMKKFNFPHT